jgi:hypothetical protein
MVGLVSNEYVAFEAYLQRHGLGYIAVDETRRALWGDTPVKSLDFVVFGRGGARLLVDVKGRRFPAGPKSRPRHVWECWSFRDDVHGIERWASLAGPDYQGLLVFAYQLGSAVTMPDSTPDLWIHRGRRYLFRAVVIDEYRQFMRVRSPRWDTVTLPKARFRALVRPFSHFTDGGGERAEEGAAAVPIPVDDDCPF